MLSLIASVSDQILSSACQGSSDPNCASQGSHGLQPVFQSVSNTLLYIIGAIAVIVIVVGGLRFVLSGGNPATTKQARETILYAVVGLVLAIMAYAIINFVFGQLSTGGN